MIFTIIPLFLCNVLGTAVSVVGIVGGVTEGADAIIRIFSGWFSDRIGKRKGLAVAGYGLSTLVKPFMYIANTWVRYWESGWATVLVKAYAVHHAMP